MLIPPDLLQGRKIDPYSHGSCRNQTAQTPKAPIAQTANSATAVGVAFACLTPMK